MHHRHGWCSGGGNVTDEVPVIFDDESQEALSTSAYGACRLSDVAEIQCVHARDSRADGGLRVGLDREPVVRIAHMVGAKGESWCVNGWRIHWTFHPPPARNAGSPKSRRRENVARDANRLRAASGDPTAGCISGIVAIGFALLRWFHRSARQPVTD